MFDKLESVGKLDRPEIATVKVGIQAYKKGTGEPKQTDIDVKKYLSFDNKSGCNLQKIYRRTRCKQIQIILAREMGQIW